MAMTLVEGFADYGGADLPAGAFGTFDKAALRGPATAPAEIWIVDADGKPLFRQGLSEGEMNVRIVKDRDGWMVTG